MDKESAIQAAVATSVEKAKSTLTPSEAKQRAKGIPKRVQVQMPGNDIYDGWHRSEDVEDEEESEAQELDQEMPSVKTRAATSNSEDKAAKNKHNVGQAG